MHAKFTSKLSTKTHLELPLPLPLTTLALPPLIISLTKIAFNSGDTSVNGIVMGFPPFLAPVSVETAFPCPPVALFGACCAMSLEAVVFRPPTIDLACSSLWLWLHFGICCSSGSGFICNESSDRDDKKPQKPKGDRGGSSHYKQTIGNFKAETMRKCIKEIKRVESTPVPPGKKRPSRNEIAASFGLSPSSGFKRHSLPYVSLGMPPLALPSVFPWLLQKQ